MRSRSFLTSLAMSLVFALALSTAPQAGRAPAQEQNGGSSALEGKGFSIVHMEPDALAALQAKGVKFKYPFPNTANKGKKFNPQGDTIPPLVTAAEQRVLVIFVDFEDTPPGAPEDRLKLSYFDDLLFGTVYDPPEYAAYPGHPTDRTLKNYYKEVSYGKVDIVTLDMPSTMGWAECGHPYGYYCRADGVHDNSFGPFPENCQGLVVDAVNAVDPYVDFSQYAVDGVVPNLFVVYAGTGAEWSGDPRLIWSHSWDLTEGTGMEGIVRDGVKINNYAMMPELGGDLTGYTGTVSGPYPPTVGVYAHEYGHVLGLPDEYDYGYESEGVGMYSLMAAGSWNRYPNERIFAGNSPAHLDAWCKYRLGFVDPVEVTGPTDVTLPPVETSPVVYKMVVPNSGGREYFLFENRQQIGFDLGFSRRSADAHGLAIYHIDDTVLTRNYWRCNEAENWKEFRSEGWRKAWTGETHYAISIIQADDQWHLERGVYTTGYEGDLYPGKLGVTSFGNDTRPNSSSYYFWGGSQPKFGYSGVTVRDIREEGGNVTCRMLFVPWSAGK